MGSRCYIETFALRSKNTEASYIAQLILYLNPRVEGFLILTSEYRIPTIERLPPEKGYSFPKNFHAGKKHGYIWLQKIILLSLITHQVEPKTTNVPTQYSLVSCTLFTPSTTLCPTS